jgi:polysaccharide deacetylase family protein (PEP-CTERM system associated)
MPAKQAILFTEPLPETPESMKCIFSVDVEDWFHILDLPSTPPLSQWAALPSRVEKNFMSLLDIFAEENVRVTCFFLGWVAERYPHLVRAAQNLGHEIASHGYAHRLIYELTPQEFLVDCKRAKHLTEDITGCEVTGYRAPGFSVTRETPWFFETLAEAGFHYDSSVFPATRGHGGLAGAECAPHRVTSEHGTLVEFPVTVTKLAATQVCLFGGGYLRVAPWALIQKGTQKVLAENRPVVFYLHPREIDPGHPRLAMSALRRFKCYANLSKTEAKVRRILSTFTFTTFAEYMGEHYASGSRSLAYGAGESL